MQIASWMVPVIMLTKYTSNNEGILFKDHIYCGVSLLQFVGNKSGTMSEIGGTLYGEHVVRVLRHLDLQGGEGKKEGGKQD